MKKIVLKFEDWLADQQYRDDLIGELARIPSMQNQAHQFSRRKFDEHKSWADIVIRIPEEVYIDVFNEAWQEFLLAKQAAKDFPD